jgi:hypothetical protein
MRKNNLDISAFLEALDQPGEYDHITKAIFRNHGIKNIAIAEALNVSPSLISKVMNGHLEPNPRVERSLLALSAFIEKFEVCGITTKTG